LLIGDVKEDNFEKEVSEPSYTDLQQRFISTHPVLCHRIIQLMMVALCMESNAYLCKYYRFIPLNN